KLSEELSEVKEAIQHKQWTDVEEEFGDVLFVLANLTRYYKIDPEIALNRANQKFTRRFSYIEKRLQELGKDIHHTSLEEIDKFLKDSRLIRRRTLAKEVADQGRISVNGNKAKPGTTVSVGDEIAIQFGQKLVTVQVTSLDEVVKKDNAKTLYKVLKEEKVNS